LIVLFYLHLIYVTIIGMHLCPICNRRTTKFRYDDDDDDDDWKNLPHQHQGMLGGTWTA